MTAYDWWALALQAVALLVMVVSLLSVTLWALSRPTGGE